MGMENPGASSESVRNWSIGGLLLLLGGVVAYSALYADPEDGAFVVDKSVTSLKSTFSGAEEELMSTSGTTGSDLDLGDGYIVPQREAVEVDSPLAGNSFIRQEVFGYELLCGTLGGDDGEGGEFTSAWEIFQRLKALGLDAGGPVVVLKGDEVKVRQSRGGADYLFDARQTKFCVQELHR
jgi:hypothetical protein